MLNVQWIVVEYVDGEGKPVTEGSDTGLRLEVKTFDFDTGRTVGDTTSCHRWSGQLQGSLVTSATRPCSAAMAWDPQRGVFAGTVNVLNGDPRGNRNGVWRPR